MRVTQGDLGLLQHPVSKELLESRIPARLAYVWTDGTPRVIPIWFHWNGRELVMATPPEAPKLRALAKNPKVSLTIDDNNFPHKVLLIRGTARLQTMQGNRARVYGSRGALFRTRTRASLDCTGARYGSEHGAHHGYAGMGRAVGFSNALSKCVIVLINPSTA